LPYWTVNETGKLLDFHKRHENLWNVQRDEYSIKIKGEQVAVSFSELHKGTERSHFSRHNAIIRTPSGPYTLFRLYVFLTYKSFLKNETKEHLRPVRIISLLGIF